MMGFTAVIAAAIEFVVGEVLIEISAVGGGGRSLPLSCLNAVLSITPRCCLSCSSYHTITVSHLVVLSSGDNVCARKFRVRGRIE